MGLIIRPLADTVTDTAAWLAACERLVAGDRASELGIDPAKEGSIIAAFEGSAAG